jgi:hypothetical protein
MAAGIPTQDNHFDDLGLTVADLRALHGKCLKSGRYPLGRLEYIDLIVAAKRRHSFPVDRSTYANAKLKWLKAEWARLRKVLDLLYPNEKHQPKRLGKPVRVA